MWPFRRIERSDQMEDALVQRVSELHYAVQELSKRMQEVLSAGEDVKRLEKRLLSTERLLQKVEGVQEDDRGRFSAALEVLRGQITGVRGGRPRRDQEATDLGQRVLEAMNEPRLLAQFIQELQARLGGPNSFPPSRTNSPV